MAIWNIIDIYRDKILLSRIQEELTAADLHGKTSSQAVDTVLLGLLRLRVKVQTVFSSDQEDIRINVWRFPKKSLVIIPAGAAHRDQAFSNTKDGEYPVDKF